ncbi:MAG: hypothetical protein JWL78_1289, partial [Chloroflexi bacterium]|nr:hypothetical protein [Chloroflexota bacterium]
MRGAASIRVMVGASVLLLLGGCGHPETTATTV